ncbi:TPA: NAD(P)-binding domain-containing protein [Campylobacter coli]|nr:NAD(P)-binding domain-containing protein [Campylobacter coli]HEB9318519.1 NAD(P)-binding domain-containing protein [Campylobacter coli]
MSKIGIVGLGFVGAASAYNIVVQNICSELYLYDIKQDLALAHARDLEDMSAIHSSYTRIIHATNLEKLANCDIIILAFRKENLKELPSRLVELQNNITELKDIVLSLKHANFKGKYIVATNPNDTITYYTQILSSLPKNHVFGSGTNLDSSRLKKILAKDLNLNPKDITAYMIGEHGDSQFAALSTASVLGQNLLTFCDKMGKKLDIENIEKAVVDEGYFIYKRKGRTEFGIGTSCANLAKAVLEDRKSLHPVSVVFDDLAFSLPAIIGKNGVEKIFELDFNTREKMKLENSKLQIKNAIQSVSDKI